MVRYNDIVKFISDTITFSDGDPVVSTATAFNVECDVQPSSQTYKSDINGDLQKAKFDVFIPITEDVAHFKNAKLAEFNGQKYSVVGIYLKQKFSHEVILGNVTK